jgi:hypothetical protein
MRKTILGNPGEISERGIVKCDTMRVSLYSYGKYWEFNN